MKSSSIQYTIRHVPKAVDLKLRAISEMNGISLNQAAIEALVKGAGLGDVPVRYHDLDSLAGTWQEDPGFDAVIAAHDQVDPDAWK